MNQILIENWSARVHRDDHVSIGEDLSFRIKYSVANYLNGLKGESDNTPRYFLPGI